MGINLIDRFTEELGRLAALAAMARVKNPSLAISRVSLSPKLVLRSRL